MRHRIGFLVVGLCFASAGSAGASNWRIAVDFSPFESVEIAANAEAEIDWRRGPMRERNACTLSYAAIDLRHHLRRVAPGDFEIERLSSELGERRIVLTTLAEAQSHPALADLIAAHPLATRLSAPGGYAWVPQGDGLVIVGRDRAGTLYGVYAFLESQGIRWFGPEEHEWHLPDRAPLRIPSAPVLEEPSFKTRGFWGSRGMDSPYFYEWMVRNRFNYWTILEPNRALLHKLGVHLTYGGHRYYERYMDPGAEYPFNHPSFEGDEHLPADPYPVSATQFRGDVDEDGRLTFFEAHPEWYGLNTDGEREPFEGYYGMNLCTSNPAPLQFLYGKIVDEVATGEWQDIDSLNFWSMDNGDWCTCEPCAALGEPTDRLLLMVHGLDQAFDAARARGELPRPLRIIFPIYQNTLAAPTRPLPRDFDYETNVGNYFPILRCYDHVIDDPTCTEYNVENWRALDGWTRAEDRFFTGEIFIGEYYNVSVNRSLPVIYPRVMQHDIPKYHAAGARHMLYMHTDTHLLGVKRINNFVYSRLLWDEAADLTAEIDGYFTHLYGPAADAVRALYDDVERAFSNIKPMRYWHHLPERIAEREFPLFDQQHFQLEATSRTENDGVDLAESVTAVHDIDAQFDDLFARNDLSAEIRRRLRDDRQTFRYGKHTVLFYDAVARAVMAEAAGDLPLARAEFQRGMPHARALMEITDVPRTAISPAAQADNGFVATRIDEAYAELAERLEIEWSE